MRDIVLISFTSINSPGGVPRWNRDFIKMLGGRHYSWEDVIQANPGFRRNEHEIPEWTRAKVLNQWLIWSKKIKKDDIIIVDGFWGEGLEDYDVISVAHGIWSHLTLEDVMEGKTPEFPLHHAALKSYRKKHLERGGKIVAVSDFIADQMKLQWGFESTVINNAVDLERFKPPVTKLKLDKPLVIHGVTTFNKGFDHVSAVEKALEGMADVMLLDDAARKFGIDKYEVLGNASLVVQPSAYEGNSYFILECLACDVPVVAYDVGLLNSVSQIAAEKGIQCCVGCVIDRRLRSPQETAKVSKFILESILRDRSPYNPRKVAELFSIQEFHKAWKEYLEEYETNNKSR